MLKWFRQLDEILRGDATRIGSLDEGKINIRVAGLSTVIILLAAIYGACMGSFNLLHPLGEEARIKAYDMYMQLLASSVKLPLLFFLTLLVTFPSLYVFNALIGSRLSVVSALRLLVASMAVMLAVLASLGPIVVFFSLSTTSYSFMILLNVAICAIAGMLGLAFLLRTLHRLVLVQEARDCPIPPVQQSQEPGGEDQQAQKVNAPPSGALDRVGMFTSRKAINVFRIWTTVFALVGAQMSWVLRPFIGNPGLGFEWFRQRESNFFLAVLRTLGNLFSS
ncbi:MAG: hypothetical protein J7M40_06270 [Planctomycetes bacterium]|nr:hypothetical protein [Planctomycetota bacterium]